MSEIARILREQEKIRRELRGLSGGRNLSFSAIENGAIADYDADGTLRTVIGRQHDGTHTIRHVDGPVPPQPTAPAVEVDGPVVRVAWDGQFAAGEQVPEDFSRVDVHVAASGRETVAGNLTTREGSAVVLKAQQSGVHTVTLVARSLSGKSSPASEAVEVDVTVGSFSGAIEAVQQSANGKNQVTYATVPPTTEDAGTEGDTWWVNEARLRDPEDPESEEYVAITEQWRHDGTQWVAVELAHEVIASVDLGTATVGYLHGKRIVAGTIDTEQLRATAIDGMVITGATIQTSHEHPKTMMDPDGVHVTDEDGQDLVYLGRQIGVRGPDGSTLAQISDDGTVSGQGLNIAADPMFLGLPLVGTLGTFESPAKQPPTGWLDMLPRGPVAYGSFSGLSGRKTTNGEVATIEVQADLYPDRMYEITVEPMTISVTGGTWCDLNLRYEWNAQPRFSSQKLHSWSISTWGASTNYYSLGGTTTYSPGSAANVRFLLSVQTPGTATIAGNGKATILIKDVGPDVQNVALLRHDNSEAGSTTPTPPPPPVVRKNYTRRYWATGGRAFYTSGGYRTSTTQYVYQGNQPGMDGMRSAILFPSMTGDLSGAEITGMTAHVDFSHWYYSAGGDAQIQLHGLTSLPTSMPSMEHGWTEYKVPKPGSRTFSIPSRYWDRFKSGSLRGIGLGDTSPSTSEYGYGHWDRAYIEVKYRK